MKPRTKARSVALQVLFEVDLVGHPPEVALDERCRESQLEPKLCTFARQIVFGVIPLNKKLDQFIMEHAPEWPIGQVAIVDRNILRIALWEFAVNCKVPTKVAINEAIELAKTFGGDSTPRFVNGVLGGLANKENEIRQAFNNYLKETLESS